MTAVGASCCDRWARLACGWCMRGASMVAVGGGRRMKAIRCPGRGGPVMPLPSCSRTVLVRRIHWEPCSGLVGPRLGPVFAGLDLRSSVPGAVRGFRSPGWSRSRLGPRRLCLWAGTVPERDLLSVCGDRPVVGRQAVVPGNGVAQRGHGRRTCGDAGPRSRWVCAVPDLRDGPRSHSPRGGLRCPTWFGPQSPIPSAVRVPVPSYRPPRRPGLRGPWSPGGPVPGSVRRGPRGSGHLLQRRAGPPPFRSGVGLFSGCVLGPGSAEGRPQRSAPERARVSGVGRSR